MSQLSKYALICILWTAAIAAIIYDSGWLTAAGVFVAFWTNNLEQKTHNQNSEPKQ